MNLQHLTKPAAPWLHLLTATPAEAWDALRALEQSSAVHVVARVVRGRKATTPAAFFDECAAALQFPPYFGENWDAWHDCMADLEWLRAEVMVLGVTDAAQLFGAAPADELQHFLTVVNALLPSASHGKKAHPARPFHLVLQGTAGEAAALKKRWAASGATLHLLQSAV
jgi:Barstar (barnase inhibitor)